MKPVRPATALLLTALIWLSASPTAAQEATPVEGAADFRTAPTIGPGTYVEELVTGEHVWYGVFYTEREDVEFEAELVGVDPADVDVEIVSSFVPPVLDACLTDDDGSWLASCHTFGGAGGGGDGEIWYVTLGLETTGQLGRVFEVEFTLRGVNERRGDLCDEPCDLQDEFEELDEEYEQLKSRAEGNSTEPSPTEESRNAEVRENIDALGEERDELSQDVEALRGEIATLCGAQGNDCATPANAGKASAPWPLNGVVAVGAVALVGELGRALWRLRSPGSGVGSAEARAEEHVG